jgi:hypothetical protein
LALVLGLVLVHRQTSALHQPTYSRPLATSSFPLPNNFANTRQTPSCLSSVVNYEWRFRPLTPVSWTTCRTPSNHSHNLFTVYSPSPPLKRRPPTSQAPPRLHACRPMRVLLALRLHHCLTLAEASPDSLSPR